MLIIKADRLRNTVGFLLLALSVFSPLSAAFAKDVLSLGVFPRRNVQVTTEMFMPLVRQLSHQLDVPIELEVSKDFESFWEGVTAKKIRHRTFQPIPLYKKCQRGRLPRHIKK